LSHPPSRFERETLHMAKQMCHASADENGFVMSYDEAIKLLQETYPGSMQVTEDFKIEINRDATHYGKNTGKTPCIMFFNRETRHIALFNKTSGDLITAEKFRQNYFTKCIDSGQVGKPTN
jgi:hypothetical protein